MRRNSNPKHIGAGMVITINRGKIDQVVASIRIISFKFNEWNCNVEQTHSRHSGLRNYQVTGATFRLIKVRRYVIWRTS